MTKNEIQQYCILYKGEKQNPIKIEDRRNPYSESYLRFHIWDAERAAVQNMNTWIEIYMRKNREIPDAEDVYKMVILDKLTKMSDEGDITFFEMYNKLRDGM